MIIVFGSLNMDMMVQVESLPQAGETVLSSDVKFLPGGKGANQAFAAARLGEKTAMVGCVGNDDFGRALADNLRRNGAMTSGVSKTENPTGTAVVTRDAKGENQIIVASGANFDAKAEQVPDEILVDGNYLLLQMELPVSETVSLLARAKEAGVTTILNLAPAIMIPQQALSCLDYLVVNSIEAAQIAKTLGLGSGLSSVKLAQALAQVGSLTCIVTGGVEGSVAVTKDGEAWKISTVRVEGEDLVDTTGAGDCYCGTLTACLHAGKTLQEAMRFASAAAALSVKGEGAQDSYPYLNDIEDLLDQVGEAEKITL
ncbi:MAG: ribokinase [Bdellovibrionales bacterium]